MEGIISPLLTHWWAFNNNVHDYMVPQNIDTNLRFKAEVCRSISEGFRMK